MIPIGIELLEDHTKNLLRRLKRLEKQEVFIGVKSSQGKHKPSGLDYSDLLWIHHNGVPSKNIPSRPVSEWTLLTFDQDIILKRSLRKYLGKIDQRKAPISPKATVAPFVQAMWQTGYEVFGNLLYLEPNKPSTIDKKGKNSPLIETGELRAEWSAYINNVKVL